MCISAVSTSWPSRRRRSTRRLIVDFILTAALIVPALATASYIAPLMINDCSSWVRGLFVPVPRQFWEGSRQDL